jgi:hypothetical protein
LVETSQKIPVKDEASLRPCSSVGVQFAASRVCDELAALALDAPPGTLTYTCAQKVIDSADAVIDGSSFG